MSQLSPDGFASRFTACSRALWCIATAILGDPDLAEDVLQEAAVTALRKLEDFDPSTSFSAWMGQIVRYTALNHARRRAKAKVVHVDHVYVSPVHEITTRIDTTAFADAKWKAIQAHASQQFGPPFRSLYEAGEFNSEAFVRIHPAVPGSAEPETDLLSGLT